MSPHAQQSFVNDLVEMAEAYRLLPQVRDELRDTQARLDSALNTVQRLEGKLHDRHAEIDGLHSQIRALEVSRDDAELRFLEAADRTEKALAFVRTVFGNSGQLLQALEPKPEPKADPTMPAQTGSEMSAQTSAISFVTEGATSATKALPLSETGLNVPSGSISNEPSQAVGSERAADPTPTSGVNGPSVGSEDIASSHSETVADIVPATPISEGQSDPLPTASQAPASDTSANSQAGVRSGPYSGKRYHDYPYYVSLVGWLEGGGTEEDYNWRPAANG